jgi:hypothetical protein
MPPGYLDGTGGVSFAPFWVVQGTEADHAQRRSILVELG